ncbi:hypothetical protein D3C71_1831950 [compost metagenome]
MSLAAPTANALTQSEGTCTRALPEARSIWPLLPMATVIKVSPSLSRSSMTDVQACTSVSSIGRSGPRLRLMN